MTTRNEFADFWSHHGVEMSLFTRPVGHYSVNLSTHQKPAAHDPETGAVDQAEFIGVGGFDRVMFLTLSWNVDVDGEPFAGKAEIPLPLESVDAFAELFARTVAAARSVGALPPKGNGGNGDDDPGGKHAEPPAPTRRTA